GSLLRAGDPGADARDQRRGAPLRVRRRGQLREVASLLRRLPDAVRRRLPRSRGGARVVLADLRPGEMNAGSGRGSILLALGLVGGVAMAASGLFATRDGGGLPADAVARVNGAVIRLEDYRRIAGGLDADRRDGLGPGDRQRVLDRMIDEELLIQRALEL